MDLRISFSYKFKATFYTWFNTRTTKCSNFTELFRDLITTTTKNQSSQSYLSVSCFHIRQWLVEIKSTNVADQQHRYPMMNMQLMRKYLKKTNQFQLSLLLFFFILHRYFSSIFPRQSKANAILIAIKRTDPVRFLKNSSNNIQM